MLDKETKAKVLALLRDGREYREVAALVGWTYKRVANIAHRNGVVQRPPIAEAMRSAALEAWRAGDSLDALESRFGQWAREIFRWATPAEKRKRNANVRARRKANGEYKMPPQTQSGMTNEDDAKIVAALRSLARAIDSTPEKIASRIMTLRRQGKLH